MRRLLLMSGVAVLLVVGAACGSPASTETIEVTATEHKFTPAHIDAKAGEVTFDVRNAGKDEHEFEIFQGTKLIAEVEDIAPGLTRSLTTDLEAGEYTYVCKVEDHEAKGEKGTLTVS